VAQEIEGGVNTLEGGGGGQCSKTLKFEKVGVHDPPPLQPYGGGAPWSDPHLNPFPANPKLVLAAIIQHVKFFNKFYRHESRTGRK